MGLGARRLRVSLVDWPSISNVRHTADRPLASLPVVGSGGPVLALCHRGERLLG